MTSSLLWFSVVLMVAAILLKKDNKISEMICGAGWLMFGFYWVTLIPSFYTKGDYTNIILTLLLFAFCLLIASFAARAFKSEARREKAKSAEATVLDAKVNLVFDLTKMIAVVCIIYMPFSLIEPLNHFIIHSVTMQTVTALNWFGYGAEQIAYNTITYNGIAVSVILACTAIESIAFFTGLILAVSNVSAKRRMVAFLITVPCIYILNLLRNMFIVVAYGDLWFGANSFEIAHHYIGKAGSGIVLIILAYLTMKLLPGFIDTVLDLWDLVTDEIRTVLKIRKNGNKNK